LLDPIALAAVLTAGTSALTSLTSYIVQHRAPSTKLKTVDGREIELELREPTAADVQKLAAFLGLSQHEDS
jgi:hypothetical protein